MYEKSLRDGQDRLKMKMSYSKGIRVLYLLKDSF